MNKRLNIGECGSADSKALKEFCSVGLGVVEGLSAGLLNTNERLAVGHTLNLWCGNRAVGNQLSYLTDNVDGLEQFADSYRTTGIAVAVV